MPENSARKFRRPAPIVTSSTAAPMLQVARRAIEYGAGCLRNALYLQRLGKSVTVVEYPELKDRFPRAYRSFLAHGGTFVAFASPAVPVDGGRGYDLAVMTYVIETICRPELRLHLLVDCRKRLKQTGTLLLSVRGVSDVVTANAKGRPCSDGFLTPHRTFIRAFTRRSVESLLESAGFDKLDFLHRSTTRSPELIHVIARP